MAYTSPSSLSDSTSTTHSDVESLLSVEFYTGRSTHLDRPCAQNNIMYPYAGYYQWPQAAKQMQHGHPQVLQHSPQHSPIGVNDQLHEEQHYDSTMIPPPSGTDVLALLSSSSYPVHESMQQQLPRELEPLDVQPWGGYFVQPPPQQRPPPSASQSRSPTEPEEPAPRKPKVSRKSESSASSQSNEQAQKKRGRPRMAVDGVLDDQPEERRRAQIRIAQRAYRYRARETLVKNKARVEKLEDTIKQMEQTILKFGQKVEHSGIDLNNDLQCDLRRTTETCQSLAASALTQPPPDAGSASPEAE